MRSGRERLLPTISKPRRKQSIAAIPGRRRDPAAWETCCYYYMMLPDRTCRPFRCPLAPACPFLQFCLSTSRLPSRSSGFEEGNTAGVGRNVAQTRCCVRPHGEEPQEPGRTAAPALWTPSPGGAGAGKAGGGGVGGRAAALGKRQFSSVTQSDSL